MPKTIYLIFVFSACLCSEAFAQSMQTLSLNDLSAFKPQSGNWRIVGDVVMDPTVESSTHEKPSEETQAKKKLKNQPLLASREALTVTPGEGILLNVNDETKKDNLITTWEHGDIELEFEVMLPKGS